MTGLDPTTMNLMVASISAAIAAAGIAISFGIANRNKTKDDVAARTVAIELAANLSTLITGVNEIKGCVNEINRKMDEHTERIIVLETNARIFADKIEEVDSRLSILTEKHNNRREYCPVGKGTMSCS